MTSADLIIGITGADVGNQGVQRWVITRLEELVLYSTSIGTTSTRTIVSQLKLLCRQARILCGSLVTGSAEAEGDTEDAEVAEGGK